MSIYALIGCILFGLILLAIGVLVFDKKHEDLRAFAGISLIFLIMGLMAVGISAIGGSGTVGPSFRSR